MGYPPDGGRNEKIENSYDPGPLGFMCLLLWRVPQSKVRTGTTSEE